MKKMWTHLNTPFNELPRSEGYWAFLLFGFVAGALLGFLVGVYL